MKRDDTITRKTAWNTTVLVTGAFGAIGSTLCTELLLRGYTVIRAGRRIPTWEKTDSRFTRSSFNVQSDLGTSDGWKRALDKVRSTTGDIDILIHCAGSLLPCEMTTEGEADLRKMVDDNILSLMLGCRAVIPRMAAGGGGHVIILGSTGGIVPMPHGAVYSATKFAVRGFSLSLAEEYRDTGVRISLVSCGPVDTRMLAAEARHRGTIGFVNRPLTPGSVARSIIRTIDHPRHETLIPRLTGWLSLAAGAYSFVFRHLYPLLSIVGRSRKRRYVRKLDAVPQITGRKL